MTPPTPSHPSHPFHLDPSILALVQRWRASPLLFAKEALRIQPKPHQAEYFRILGELVHYKESTPIPSLSPSPSPYANKRGISVMSAKGCGKGTCAAVTTAWFQLFYPSKNFLISPSFDNLRASLLAEFNKWLNQVDPATGLPLCPIKDELVINAKKIYRSSDPGEGKEYFTMPISAGPNTPTDEAVTVLAGKHSRYMAIIADEASGISDAVFSTLDTTLTDPINFALLFFNPTRTSGFAYDTHFSKESKYWITLHWDAPSSDLVSPDQIQYLADKYGTSSPEYRVSVLGLPPEGEESSIIPYSWVHTTSRDNPPPPPSSLSQYPVTMGVDVGRENDPTAIVVRHGPVILHMEEIHELDTCVIAQHVHSIAPRYSHPVTGQPPRIYVDTIGVGAGVYDNLRRLSTPSVFSCKVSSRPSRPETYTRLKDELWFLLREWVQAGFLKFMPHSLFDDMRAELSSVRYKAKPNGLIEVESKSNLKSRGLKSPNLADALVLTMMSRDINTPASSSNDDDPDYNSHSSSRARNNKSKFSWLGA